MSQGLKKKLTKQWYIIRNCRSIFHVVQSKFLARLTDFLAESRRRG